jgi:hypothetical protein
LAIGRETERCLSLRRSGLRVLGFMVQGLDVTLPVASFCARKGTLGTLVVLFPRKTIQDRPDRWVLPG